MSLQQLPPQNFHHIHQDEELLRLKLNQLITNENKLSQQETVLHNKIQILEIDTYEQTRTLEFEQRRNQQLGSLTNMIQNSVLKTTIKYLHLGLQTNQTHYRECQNNRCIQNIRVSHKQARRGRMSRVTLL